MIKNSQPVRSTLYVAYDMTTKSFVEFLSLRDVERSDSSIRKTGQQHVS